MFGALLAKVGDSLVAHRVRRVRRYLASLFLRRFIAESLSIRSGSNDRPRSRIIWQLWDDGNWDRNETHSLVRISIRSVVEFSRAKGYHHRLISFQEGFDLLDINLQLRLKFSTGRISKAQMSDIIRAGLLGKFGGIWMDATIFICDYEGANSLLERDMFVTHTKDCSKFRGDFFFDSYLIACDENSPLLWELHQALVRYWNANSFAIDYFQFHILLSLIVKAFGVQPNCLTPLGVPRRMHAMQRALLGHESPREISDLYPFQKLTHKIAVRKIHAENPLYRAMLRLYDSSR